MFVTESECFVTIAGSIGVFVTEIVCFVTITGSAVLFVTESDCFVTIATGSFGANDKSPPGTGARRGVVLLKGEGLPVFKHF